MKTTIKVTITIFLTIWAQFEVIRENRYWGIGGNVLIPFLLIIIFWIVPYYFKLFKGDFIEFFKNLETMEGY